MSAGSIGKFAGFVRLIGVLPILAASPARAEGATLRLESAQVRNGHIEKIIACRAQGGADKSPQLSISGIPAGTAYLAIVVDDPDAMPVAGKTWVHWNVVNLPAATTNLALGEKPPGEPLRNSWGRKDYGGMCPPNGTHTYNFAVFALREKADVAGGVGELTIEAFAARYKSIIIEKAVIQGRFG